MKTLTVNPFPLSNNVYKQLFCTRCAKSLDYSNYVEFMMNRSHAIQPAMSPQETIYNENWHSLTFLYHRKLHPTLSSHCWYYDHKLKQTVCNNNPSNISQCEQSMYLRRKSLMCNYIHIVIAIYWRRLVHFLVITMYTIHIVLAMSVAYK